MLGIPHPRLTASLPGVGGEIKTQNEDFVVEEVPLYEPCGEGEHTFVEIEKTDLATRDAIDQMARRLGVSSARFGYAGLKDRKGVTRQFLSITLVPQEPVEKLDIPGIKVLRTWRHTNKLRIGHLRGNRFRIRVRGVHAEAEHRVAAILQPILANGMPNYFGQQRFGTRADAHFVGRAILRRDYRTAVHRFIGYPASSERNPAVVRARELFMEGRLDEAHQTFPNPYRDELAVLHHLRRHSGDYEGGIGRLRESSRKMFLTAFQSYLFNLILSRRMALCDGNLAKVFPGDLCYLHRNGAVFLVDRVDEEQPRADALEISPSGPMFGETMPVPHGVPAEIEANVVEREAMTPDQIKRLFPRRSLRGGRRPFRVRVEDLEWSVRDGDLFLSFFLPKGAYATTLLREITKNEMFLEEYYRGGEEEKHDLWRPAAADSSGGEA